MTQQRRDGDRHVYGARSRFMTDPVLATTDRRFAGRPEDDPGRPGTLPGKRIDVAARLREMW